MLGSLALAAVVGIVLVGACLSLVVSSTPKHTLEVPLGELTAGLPRFYPQPSFGADANGRTFGVWVLVPATGGTRAFSAQDPGSGCFVNWRGELTVEGETGVFRDSCSDTSYSRDGEIVSGTGLRGIDAFEVEVTRTAVVVDLERVRLGRCRDGVAEAGCSTPGVPRYEAR